MTPRTRILGLLWSVCLLVGLCQGITTADTKSAVVTAPAIGAKPSVAQLLDQVQRRAFDFFWNESDPETGITRDRAGNTQADVNNVQIGSIASTGYALSALPVGVEHGWVSKSAAYNRALITLRFFNDKLPNDHGWFFHFIDLRTGARAWNSEVSSIDTALFLLGALTVGQYFSGTEVQSLSESLYDRVDFQWMRTEGGDTPGSPFLAMGMKPESSWISRWNEYNECPMLYLLALGSKTHPLSPTSWQALNLTPIRVEGYDVIGPPLPLFIAQMPAGYFDYRGKRDVHGIDFWVNSVNSHLANHAYCVNHASESKTYSDTIWGLSANDVPDGYGALSPSDGGEQGTISPTAEITSILFVPDLGKRSVRGLFSQYKDQMWGRYGFSNALNVDKNWFDKDVIGIDLGMMLVAVEDYRSGLIWKLMDKTAPVRVGMARAGFHETTEEGPRPLIVLPAGTDIVNVRQ